MTKKRLRSLPAVTPSAKPTALAMPSKYVGPEPEAASIEEQGLGWKSKLSTGKGDDAIGSGLEVIWTTTPTKWSNNFFDEPVQLRMGTDQESGRCASVDAEKWRRQRHGAGCARSLKASLALHADHGPLLAARSGLRKDFTALLRASGPVRRRVCAGVVQADPPRHGADRALPRPAGSEGDTWSGKTRFPRWIIN